MREHLEVETKFDVPVDLAVPDIAKLVPNGGVEPAEVCLVSTYYDTPDLALTRLGRTLRLRSGSDDQQENGWQLKVPERDSAARMELRAEGDETDVPDDLASLILGATHGRDVRPIARTSVRRVRHRLRDASGTLLLELADDDVEAVELGGAGNRAPEAVRRWRELEIELGEGDPRLIERAARLLLDAGARPAQTASKLQRALGMDADSKIDAGRRDSERTSTGPRANRSAHPKHGKQGKHRSAHRPTYGSVVLDYLHAQFAAVEREDLQVRRRAEDAVHRQRVAIRRARSTLRVFRTLFLKDAATRLDDELRWFAGVLGEVRDHEVLRSRLSAAVAALPDELVLGPVASDIDAVLGAEQRDAQERLDDAMSGERYLAMLTLFDQWRAQAPVEARQADASADHSLRAAAKAQRKLQFRLDRAAALARRAAHHDAGGPEPHGEQPHGDQSHELDGALHAARKQAKRVRYALEAVEDVPGSRAKRARSAMTALQDALGEHQDSVVAAGVLRRLGAAAGVSTGANGFTYGLLYERERENARRSAQALLARHS